MATEMTTVIKKIVPYLQRRGYSLDDNMFFGARAENEQESAGFVDILVRRSKKAQKALFLVEAKRDTAKLGKPHREQALNYGKVLGVPFVVVTNGEEFELHNTVTRRKSKVNGSVIGKVPRYNQLDAVLAQFRAVPQLDNVDLSGDDSLPFRPGLNLPQLHALIRRCHTAIRNVEKDEENVFGDVSKLLFLKLLEEKQDRGEIDFELPYSYRFHELAQRKKAPDQVKDAVLSMMNQVISLPRYGEVMTPTLNMQHATTFLKVVTELSKANFTDSELDVRGSVFEYFMRVSLKGRRLGQFFTPRPLVRFMLSLVPLEQVVPDLLDPDAKPTIIDPACGSGGFLLASMNLLLRKVEEERGTTYANDRADWLAKRIKRDVFWGVDANHRIASAAKMNMIIAGDGFANIRHGDSLTENVDFLRVSHRTLPLADFVLTNPPFGMSEADTLMDADLALFSIQMTKTQALFLQKMVEVTKPSGHICTVIDDGMLNTKAMTRIRQHLLDRCFVDAVIRLPEVTFQPNRINVRSSVLLLTRKPHEDAIQEHPIRMIDLRQVGYTSTGEEDPATPIEDVIDVVRARWDDIARIEIQAEDTGDAFVSYPLGTQDVLGAEGLRLDFKFYDPATLATINELRSAGARPLGELVTAPVKRGRSPLKAEYNVDKTSPVIVVKAGNVGKEELARDFDTITETVYERLKDAQLRQGDLLLASTGEGTLGKAVVYDRETDAVADGHVTVLRLIDDLNPEYVVWFLRSPFGQSQINRLFTGATGQIELPEDAVKQLLILTPDKHEQERLAADWSRGINEANALETEAQARRKEATEAFVGALRDKMGFRPVR